jgi:hypothetical protein
MRRPHSGAMKREGTRSTSVPWVIPVGILGTAAEMLTRIASNGSALRLNDPRPDIQVPYVNAHGALLAAAARFCRVPHRRYVLAEAAASLLATRLVDLGQVKASPGEGPDRLVWRWADARTLAEVARELDAVANLERLRRLAELLGRDGLHALLRSEVDSGVPRSGAALAQLDFARWTRVGVGRL